MIIHIIGIVITVFAWLNLANKIGPNWKPSKLANVNSRNGARVLEEPMTAFLLCVRDSMTEGIPEHNIPHFNPLYINATSIELGLFGICSGNFDLQDFILTGFNTFEVSHITGTVGIIPPRFELVVELTWNLVSFITKYDLHCITEDGVVSGTGNIEGKAIMIRSLIDFVVHLLPDIDIQDASFWLSLEGFDSFEITGLRNDEEYSAQVSQYIFENGSQILQDLDPFISDLFAALLEALFGSSDGIQEGGLLDYLVTKCLVV